MFSTITTSGQRCTAAKLIPSWNAPVDVAPSPTYTSPTRSCLRILKRQRDAGHHRNHVAERRDLSDEAALGVAEVDVQLAAARRRIALRHVLLEDLDRRRALHEHRAEVANERRQNVAALERVRAADRIGFLSERPKQSADDFRLPVQRDEPLLERAREAHPVVEIEQLFSRQRRMRRSRAARLGGFVAERGMDAKSRVAERRGDLGSALDSPGRRPWPARHDEG